MKTKLDWKVMVLILAAIVIVLMLGIYEAEGPVGPSPVYAPSGTLAQGFPAELVLNADMGAPSSYSLEGQTVAEWQSSFSIDQLYNSYQDYFNGTGWNIVNENAPGSTMRGIYATQGNAEVDVAISAENNNGSDVVVSYLTNGN